MLDQFSEVLYFVKGVARNKWIVTAVASIVCIAGWVGVSKMPDKYESTARVHVDTRTMLRPLLRGLAIQSDVRGLIAIMKKLMFTQQNMIKVAELAGMDVDLKSENKVHTLVSKLKEKVKIEGGRGEIFKIKFESDDPVNAKNVVQAVLTVFSEQTQKSSLSDVDSAKRFIDNQIREYEQRLQNAEKAKESFKRNNIGLLPGQDGAGQFSEMQAIRQKMDVAKMLLAELLSRRGVLQKQLSEALESGEEWGLTEIVDSISIEDARIKALQDRKDEILLKYTKNHPSIATIDSEIVALKQRKLDEESVTSPFGSDLIGSGYQAMSNPYVQSIKIALNNIDSEAASLNSRIQSYQNKLKKEDDQFNTRLEIETEMQNLNRDYATIKKNYLALIDRREQARMSSSVDAQVSALKFKVIDPAHVPQSPSSPNRRLFFSIVLVAGFIIGLVVALITVFLRPTVVDAKQLRDLTGLAVLGVISEVVKDGQVKQNRLRIMRYLVANTSILLMYAIVMYLNLKL